MDLRQLNALLAVADTGSFSAAARVLHTVQSNVSTHVARLEKELRATLIDRSTGSLTEEGEVVAARARRIRAELDALLADLASLHDEVAGTARIGVIGTTARWLVPRLVDAMQARYPKVRVVIVDATTTSLALQLSSGLLDLAVVNLPLNDPEIRTDHLFDEDRLLVVPADHPLFERDRLTLADLDGEPLLLEPKGTAFRDHLDEQCRQAGIELEPQAEVDGMRLLASLAFQGFGAALLPASAAPSWVGGEWKRVPVDGLEGRSVGLASRRRGMLSAPARALREVLLDVIRTEGPKQPGIHTNLTDG
ncbi:MAG: LysR family transcriptional regulator [Acidimicrobiales bacterium]|jgi:LysR family hydrogen peroxide-inducible transcriptional activator